MSLTVDMDKVPPLPRSARSTNSAPGSARSGCSSARTGGGTARSTDSKGTPRDCERLPLGTRPRPPVGEVPRFADGLANSSHGLHTPPIPSSPLTTGRSGAVPSTPSSTQGDALSSRSRTDSLSCLPQEGGLILAQHHLGLTAEGCAASNGGHIPRPAWCADLSREIEAMRHVILQENEKLKEQLRDLKSQTSNLQARCGPNTDGHVKQSEELVAKRSGATLLRSPIAVCQRRRVVEWCIRGLDGSQAYQFAHCNYSTFQLPEYPNISFNFAFGARSSAGSGRSDGQDREEQSCCLRLGARGLRAAGICFEVLLEVEELMEDRASSSAASQSENVQTREERLAAIDSGDSSSDDVGDGSESGRSHSGLPIEFLGRHSVQVLRGGGHILCPCKWPSCASATIICRADMEFAGFCPVQPSVKDNRIVTACRLVSPLGPGSNS